MKKALSILISLVILGVLYWKVDVIKLLGIFQHSHWVWMTVSLAMTAPLILFTSWRLQWLMPREAPLSFNEASRLILLSSVLNMILPSKMGDVSKAYFMAERGHLRGSLALSLVVFEKACDMLSLLLWCALALLVYPNKNAIFWIMTACIVLGFAVGLLMLASRTFARFFFNLGKRMAPAKMQTKLQTFQVAWDEMHTYFWGDKVRLLWITTGSVFLWFLHLVQIWLFVLALNAWMPFTANLALAPLAILTGLLPLTFAGVGTRDAAIVMLYQPYINAPTAAALGVLCTSRYLLPALAGIPYLGEYMSQPFWRSKKQISLQDQLSSEQVCG